MRTKNEEIRLEASVGVGQKDVLQLSRWLSGDVKESRKSNRPAIFKWRQTTWHHPLCRPVVSWLFSLAARC